MTIRAKTLERIKVDSKGRVSIPKSLRKSLSLGVGRELEVHEEGGRIVLVPLIEDPIEAIFDVLNHVLPRGKTATEIQHGLRTEWDQDIEKESSYARGVSR